MVNCYTPAHVEQEKQEFLNPRNRLVRTDGIPAWASEQWTLRLQQYNAFAGYTYDGESLAFFVTGTRANNFIRNTHGMQFMGGTIRVTSAIEGRIADYDADAAIAQDICQDRDEQWNSFPY